jgi:Tfp pilus assembly protein PilP
MRGRLLAVLAIAASARLGAQRQPTPPAQPAERPAGEGTYTYQPGGRRDPFLSLLGAGVDSQPGARRSDGPAGWLVGEVSVRGVARSGGALIAMVQGPDNKTYLLHQGDRLADGFVKTVTPEGLVLVQEIRDPLSPVKQREVRKTLRTSQDGKP